MEKGYNLIEASELLGIKVRTARKWIKDGIIKAHQIPSSRRWIVMESEIKRLQGGDISEDESC